MIDALATSRLAEHQRRSPWTYPLANKHLQNRWFLAKLALISLALAKAALRLRAVLLPASAAIASVLLWTAALVAGQMTAFA